MTLRCGEIVERRRNRRNAGDAENGIEQGAIFGAETGDFNSLLCVSSAFTREFGFEGAGAAGCGEVTPEITNIERGTQ